MRVLLTMEQIFMLQAIRMIEWFLSKTWKNILEDATLS